VAPGRSLVGIGRLSSAPAIANQQMVHHLLGRLCSKLGHSSHDYSFFGVVSEFQVTGRGY